MMTRNIFAWNKMQTNYIHLSACIAAPVNMLRDTCAIPQWCGAFWHFYIQFSANEAICNRYYVSFGKWTHILILTLFHEFFSYHFSCLTIKSSKYSKYLTNTMLKAMETFRFDTNNETHFKLIFVNMIFYQWTWKIIAQLFFAGKLMPLYGFINTMFILCLQFISQWLYFRF